MTAEASSPRQVRLAVPLVLASASPRRAAILRRAGFRFSVVPAGRVEDARVQGGATPEATVATLAGEKAALVARSYAGGFTLGADTVVVLDGRLLGKPVDGAEARAMLRSLRARAHTVVTGVAVAGPRGVLSGTRATIVRFRRYSDGEIDAYVRGGSPMDKAGAYGIQDRAFEPAAAVTGCYLNVVGLPLCLTIDLLREAGALLDRPEELPRCLASLADAGIAAPATGQGSSSVWGRRR